MRRARRMLAMGAFGAPAAEPAPEQHYLPFDGVTDFAYADAGATGYTTTYAIVFKIADLPAQTGAWPIIGHLSAAAATPFANNVTDVAQLQAGAPNQYRHVGVTTAGAVNYSRATGGTGQCNGQQVHMLGRDLTGNTARVRIINGGDQSVFWGPADAATSQDSAPDDICIGAYLNPALTLNSAPCDVRLIAVVFLDAIPSDADLQLYAAPTCRDARPIFGAAIKGYWAASSAVAGSIPALVGTAPITLSGPVAGDLVALPAAVTSYYSSPGGAGDYAEASSNVAARVVFPGGSMGTFSAGGWFRQPDANGVSFMVVGTVADDGISVYASGRAEQDIDVLDAGVLDQFGFVVPPDDDTWVRLVLVKTGAAEITPYLNGVAQTAISGLTGTYATAQDVFKLLRDGTGIGDCRNIIINDRAHTAGEEAALYAAGPTHNPLAGTGAWAGGQSIPVLWTTAAVGGVVVNSGDGGACNLVLNGAVASLEDA